MGLFWGFGGRRRGDRASVWAFFGGLGAGGVGGGGWRSGRACRMQLDHGPVPHRPCRGRAGCGGGWHAGHAGPAGRQAPAWPPVRAAADRLAAVREEAGGPAGRPAPPWAAAAPCGAPSGRWRCVALGRGGGKGRGGSRKAVPARLSARTGRNAGRVTPAPPRPRVWTALHSAAAVVVVEAPRLPPGGMRPASPPPPPV